MKAWLNHIYAGEALDGPKAKAPHSQEVAYTPGVMQPIAFDIEKLNQVFIGLSKSSITTYLLIYNKFLVVINNKNVLQTHTLFHWAYVSEHKNVTSTWQQSNLLPLKSISVVRWGPRSRSWPVPASGWSFIPMLFVPPLFFSLFQFTHLLLHLFFSLLQRQIDQGIWRKFWHAVFFQLIVYANIKITVRGMYYRTSLQVCCQAAKKEHKLGVKHFL